MNGRNQFIEIAALDESQVCLVGAASQDWVVDAI